MPDRKEETKLLLSDTSVPDVFLVHYAPELSKDAIHLYLWILMDHKDLQFETKDLSHYSYIPSSDVDKALAELIEKDLLIKKDRDHYTVPDLKQREVDDYIRARLPADSSSADLDSLALSEDEKARNVLAESISSTFYQGRLAYTFYRLIDKCLYEYKMDSKVVYRLFEEGKKKRIHFYITEMRRLAEEWFRKNIITTKDLSAYLAKSRKVDELTSLMGKMTRKRLNGIDLERIDRWVYEMDVSPKLVEYAFRCNEYRGNITLKDVEDKLSEWISAGIRDVDAAMVHENERKNENKKKAVRKKGRDNTWKTGGEAGLLTENKEEKKDDGSSDAEDVILELFGGADEND